MLRPERMVKLNALVLEKFMAGTTMRLGESGLVHLVSAPDQSESNLLDKVDLSGQIGRLVALDELARAIMNSLHIDAAPEATGDEPIDLDQTESYLKDLDQEVQEELAAIHGLIQESGLLAKTVQTLESLPVQQTPLTEMRDLNHLYITTGRIPAASYPEFAAQFGDDNIILHKQTGESESVMILSGKKSRWALETDLNNTAFEPITLPNDLEESPAERLEKLDEEIDEIRGKINEHKLKSLKLGEMNRSKLGSIAARIENQLSIYQAQQHFGKTGYLYCISGWLPEMNKAQVEEAITEETMGTAVIEFHQPSDDERVRAGLEKVPIRFREHRLLSPFQQLVATFGAPRYGELEPSLFVAASFILMFGIMFGDVGQGAVLVLAGVYMIRTKKFTKQAAKDAGYMLTLCGTSAIIFGFLYGSIFGYEHLLPHLWLSPLHDVMTLFITTVTIGVCCISISLIFNIVNKLRMRDYYKGIFDKFGVIGAVFYWGTIAIGIKAVVQGEISFWEVTLVTILPLFLLFIGEPLYNVLARKDKLIEHDLIGFVLEAAIEVMETLTTFLGSTVSFVRVGAFALSHAALCLAIYTIVDMLKGAPGGTFLAVLLVICGNILVIALEGMVVTIQGIRLQYYELFSKYFSGDGVLYKPFALTGYSENNQEETK